MALSTVACAVIIRICGRSRSGGEADDLANQLQAGELRHQVVDDEQVERPLAEQAQRLARSPVARRCGPRRAAPRPSALQDLRLRRRRAELIRASRCGSRAGDRASRCERSVPVLRRLSIAIVPPRPSMMFLAIGEAEPRAVAPRREVRLEEFSAGLRRDAGAPGRRRRSATRFAARAALSAISAPARAGCLAARGPPAARWPAR